MSEKEPVALDIVRRKALWAAGVGLVPIPLVNIAGIAAFEGKMLYDLSNLYEIPFREDRVRTIVASLIGGFASTDLAYGSVGMMLKAVPILGPAMAVVALPFFAGAITYAIGKVFIQHFEAGGTFLDFEPDKVKAYFEQQFRDFKSAAA